MPLRSLLALVAALTALPLTAAPPMAGANHGVPASCGGGWEGADACTMLIRGSPITVEADAETADPDQAVEVRVWIELIDGMPLLECSASGTGETSCAGQIGPDPWLNFPGQIEFLVTCRVEGTPSGGYWCQSGTGT